MMPKMRRSGGLLVAIALVMAVGCTNDFSAPFAETQGTGGSDASVDSSQDAAMDATDGSVGKDGANDSDAKDAKDAAPLDGPDDAACFPGSKSCGGTCVETSLPSYGCAPNTCTPCVIPNANAKCSNEACAIESCIGLFADCKNGVTDGCETPINTLENCKACGTPCVLANATGECSDGLSCKVASCKTGYVDCDTNPTDGCETFTSGDVNNCGTCGKVCTPPNVGDVMKCDHGTCKIDLCQAPTADCNNDSVCETNTQTDVNNCGMCGRVCSYPNATAACASGVCVMSGCVAPFGDCNNNAADGCEVNLDTSPTNCGSCAGLCKSAHGKNPACQSGLCTLTCDDGWDNCNGPHPGNDPKNDGCEVNISADPTQCGGCGKPCSSANGSNPTCASGKCSLACDAGFADCDGPAPGALSNGCEIDIASDPGHCGACVNGCNSTNGTPTCMAGVCGIMCNNGYANCNGTIADGCEINTGGDVAHCGTCTTVCSSANGTASCNSGACAIACALGWGNCDSNVTNGCEIPTANDPLHCGSCNACPTGGGTPHGMPTCTGTVCGFSCDSGFGNCNGSLNDGCEAPLNTTSNCGACGTACSGKNANWMCPGGAACEVVSCFAPFGNCDGDSSNGCEINFNKDNNHCGNCSTQCPGAKTCQTGICQL